ncbi:DUF58 domain-containing protein [Crassaminicella profunda]|uniref:DUF58 domain-containing protein n=1 Tax=Crassaminicella profunda TaxID=1286698 RepID=UPI001CA63064|nr:DUF58 domain-containing protein [Crassaminicella profunda]QZY56103.1 DUF58 domain-containing protein [Crassaminicella profunda]
MDNKIIDSTLLRKLDRLKLNTNLLLNQGYNGGRKSNGKGSSIEFSDYKEYVLGDDFRKIDWNAYGRFQKLYVKLFEEERQASVNIFLDTSLSMDFGNPKKSLIAKKIASALSYISLSNLDAVNIYSNGENELKETGYFNGKNTFQGLLKNMEKASFFSKNDLFQFIKKKNYKKGITMILSDLYSDYVEESIKYLSYKNQRIIVLHVLSKEELAPDLKGDLRFIDSETEEEKDVSVTNPVLKAYEKTLKNFIREHKEICRKYGCKYILVSNEISIEEILFDQLVKHGILR